MPEPTNEELQIQLEDAINNVHNVVAQILAPGGEISEKNKDRIRGLAVYAPE